MSGIFVPRLFIPHGKFYSYVLFLFLIFNLPAKLIIHSLMVLFATGVGLVLVLLVALVLYYCGEFSLVGGWARRFSFDWILCCVDFV
jgi:hypothetical protein